MRCLDGRRRLRGRCGLGTGRVFGRLGGLLVRRLLVCRLVRGGLRRRCFLRGRFTLAVEFHQGLADLQVVAFFHEQVCDRAGGRCRHRHGRLIGFQLDQRLSLRHLVAFLDQNLDDVTAFDTFSEKRQFDSHGSSFASPDSIHPQAAQKGRRQAAASGRRSDSLPSLASKRRDAAGGLYQQPLALPRRLIVRRQPQILRCLPHGLGRQSSHLADAARTTSRRPDVRHRFRRTGAAPCVYRFGRIRRFLVPASRPVSTELICWLTSRT